jgi:hypothetical protein
MGHFLFHIVHWNDHLQDNCEGPSEGSISFLANFIIYMSVENLFCLSVLSEKNTAEKSYYIYITSDNFAISTKKWEFLPFIKKRTGMCKELISFFDFATEKIYSYPFWLLNIWKFYEILLIRINDNVSNVTKWWSLVE